MRVGIGTGVLVGAGVGMRVGIGDDVRIGVVTGPRVFIGAGVDGVLAELDGHFSAPISTLALSVTPMAKATFAGSASPLPLAGLPDFRL